jgi:fructokinase
VIFLRKHPIEEIGIATFGPLDLNKNSSSYGNIMITSKKLWINFPLLRTLKILFKDVKLIISGD